MAKKKEKMLTKKQASQGVLWTRNEWRCPYNGRNKERRKEGERRRSLRQQHRAKDDDDDVVIGRELEEEGENVTVRGYFGSKRLPNRGTAEQAAPLSPLTLVSLGLD